MADQQDWAAARTPFLLAAWRALVTNRCPHCAQTPMFNGFYTMYPRCTNCSLRYERESGAWLGALALGYGIGALVAIGLAVLEVWMGPLDALGLPPMWTIAALSLLATVVGYRPAKAAWFVLLYYYGFMDFIAAPTGVRSLEESRRE